MGFVTPILCDRRIYDKKGKWKSPNNDIAENIYYFVKEPLTLIPTYENGRETFKGTTTITVFGNKAFAKEDTIIDCLGNKYKVQSYTLNYIEHNILVKDMLKPRVASIDIVLE